LVYLILAEVISSYDLYCLESLALEVMVRIKYAHLVYYIENEINGFALYDLLLIITNNSLQIFVDCVMFIFELSYEILFLMFGH
jgi:hypothetical protein